MADAVGAENESDRQQLRDVIARIGKARSDLKALRIHPMEGSKGKPGASFITGKERMIEAAEATKQLDAPRQREHEIQAKLQPGNQPCECQDRNLHQYSARVLVMGEGCRRRHSLFNDQYYHRIGYGMTPEQFGDSLAVLEAGPLGEARNMRIHP